MEIGAFTIGDIGENFWRTGISYGIPPFFYYTYVVCLVTTSPSKFLADQYDQHNQPMSPRANAYFDQDFFINFF